MKLVGKSWLVPGVAGFIGSHLVDVLLKRGSKVRVLDNLINGGKETILYHLDNKNFEFVKGSITDMC